MFRTTRVLPAALLAVLAPFAAGASNPPLPAVPPDDEVDVVAVLDVRSSLDAAGKAAVDVAPIAEQLRAAARTALPDARILSDADVASRSRGARIAEDCGEGCDAELGRAIGADLVVSGDVARTAEGFRFALELHETDGGRLLAKTTAAGDLATLGEVVSASAAELFKPLRGEASIAAVADRPVKPLAPALAPALERHAGLDAEILDAWREARSAEASGRTLPDAVVAAWERVANVAEGAERGAALARAHDWRVYGRNLRAWEARLDGDRAKLRKALARGWVAERTKLDLLAEHAKAYGFDEAALMVPSLRPVAAAERAKLLLSCEAKGAAACARLAQIYEEGDGTLADQARGAALRQMACGAGDGKSCRRLACLADTDVPADAARAADLFKQGCDAGDAGSCAMVAAAEAKRAPKAAVASAAKPAGPAAKPSGAVVASAVLRQTAAPAPSTPSAALALNGVERAEPNRSKFLGGFLLTAGSIATAGALVMAASSTHDRYAPYYGRHSLYRDGVHRPSTGSLVIGTAGVISLISGIVLLARPDEPERKVGVGVTPNGIGISGKLP